jgi:hypothetical protein
MLTLQHMLGLALGVLWIYDQAAALLASSTHMTADELMQLLLAPHGPIQYRSQPMSLRLWHEGQLEIVNLGTNHLLEPALLATCANSQVRTSLLLPNTLFHCADDGFVVCLLSQPPMDDAQCLGAIEQGFNLALQYEPVLPSAQFNHNLGQADFVRSLAALFGYTKYLEIGKCAI